jgi:hypothetical protein
VKDLMPPASSIVVVENGPVTIGIAETSLFPTNASNGIGIPAMGPGRPGWVALAIVTVPGITNVLANATVTIKVRAGGSPADPEIGTMKYNNPTNQTSPIGIGSLVIPVPAGTQSVFVGIFVDSGAPVAQATATEPIAFVLLGLTTPD